MSKVVGALAVATGEVSWHASACMAGNFHTLCSLSLDDAEFREVKPRRGQKVTCAACRQNWREAKNFTSKDFEAAGKEAQG